MKYRDNKWSFVTNIVQNIDKVYNFQQKDDEQFKSNLKNFYSLSKTCASYMAV